MTIRVNANKKYRHSVPVFFCSFCCTIQIQQDTSNFSGVFHYKVLPIIGKESPKLLNLKGKITLVANIRKASHSFLPVNVSVKWQQMFVHVSMIILNVQGTEPGTF